MAKRTNRHIYWKTYRHKSVKRNIIEAYDRYIAGLFEEDDGGRPSTKFWKAVKANKRDTVGVTSLKDENGEVMTTSKKKAGILSHQYQKVFTNKDVANIPSMGTNPYPTMADMLVTTKRVEALLK